MIYFFESIQNKRSNNEDSYCHMEIRVNHEARVSAFAIADGMGGLTAGKQYSEKAVSLWFQSLVQILMGEQFKDCALKTQIETLKEFSGKIFHEINRVLYERGMDQGIQGGTTLTTVIHFWDTWIIANCGDSPVYCMKEGKLILMSDIQNVAWQMVKENKTQIGSTLFYQNKNRLLEYLGRREPVHPYITMVGEEEVNAILMGSDGAFGGLTMQRMEQIYLQTKDNSQILTRILEECRNIGETDNQTAFLILQEEPRIRVLDQVTEKMSQRVQAPVTHLAEEKEQSLYRTIEEEPLAKRLFKRFKNSGKRRS